MFDFTDRRTAAERDRDVRMADQRASNAVLSRGEMDKVRDVLKRAGFDVGLVGSGSGYSSEASLLLLDGEITYELSCRVSRAD